jgi:hypothetical protein
MTEIPVSKPLVVLPTFDNINLLRGHLKPVNLPGMIRSKVTVPGMLPARAQYVLLLALVVIPEHREIAYL